MKKRKGPFLTASLALICTTLVLQSGEAAPAKEPWPITVEADELYFQDTTGDLHASGHVRIEKEADVLTTEKLQGNMQSQEVWTPGEAVLTRPDMHITVRSLKYNYAQRDGEVQGVSGKIGRNFVKVDHARVEKEQTILYDGYVTGCPAKVPDYRIAASKVVIQPNRKMVLYDAKFMIKNMVLFSVPVYQTRYTTGEQQRKRQSIMPRLDYSTSDGWSLSQHLEMPLQENTDVFVEPRYYSKKGFKFDYGVRNHQKWFTAQLAVLNDENSDNVWIKREPELSIDFKPMTLARGRITVSSFASVGRWKEGDIVGRRTGFGFYAAHRPIALTPKVTLNTGVGWRKLTYDYDNTDNRIFEANFRFSLQNSKRLQSYAGYNHRETTGTSPYEYDRIDINHELVSGFMYQVDRMNGLGVDVTYNLDTSTVKDLDYRWKRNLHCWQLDLTYRSKRDQYIVNLSTIRW